MARSRVRSVVHATAATAMAAAVSLLAVAPASAAPSTCSQANISYSFDTSDVAAGATATDYSPSPAGPAGLVIPSSITCGGQTYSVTGIGANAFAFNQVTSVSIPNTVTTIGDQAFASDLLTSVTIPDSVTTVGDSAFAVNQLTTATIGNSVIAIPDQAFAENQLTSVTIGSSVTAIGDFAFKDNYLASVTIPGSVTTIGDEAFFINELTSITIPDSVTTIGTSAFYSNHLTSATFGNSLLTIGVNAFTSNSLASVVIPNSVTAIGPSAFSFNALTSATIGSSVTEIGDSAFYGNHLTSVTIPGSVTTIATAAFDQNPLLTSVTFAGPAPTTIDPAGQDASLGTAPGLIVHYDPAFDDANTSPTPGFTTPTWKGYTTQVITADEAPTVTTDPSNQVVNAGGTATFAAAASGSPTPTVQWQVDAGAGFTNMPGETSTTLTLSGVTAVMSGNTYRAVFTNSSGSDTSTAATLTVNTAPSVTTNPTDKTVNSGGTATFTAAASGSPAPSVQWQVDAGSGFSNIAGATSTTLTFTATDGMSGNTYRAVFTNAAGSDTTSAATLTVNTGPVVTTDPSDQTVTAGGTASFTAAASGSPSPTVQWQVDAGAGFTNMPGETSTTLTLSGVTAVMSGNKYRAVFTNSVGNDTSTAATLTANAAPSVTTDPSDQTVSAGGTATFTAAASGSPTPTVQWQVDTGSGFSNVAGATSTTLTFTATAGMSGNTYRAVFTNSVGNDTTTAATLTVDTAPVVTTNPSDQTVNSGGTATFTAAASGSPSASVQWQVDTGGGFSDVAGATSTTLTFTATAGMSGNTYRAVFTNSAGSDTTAAAALTVNTGPVVATDPSDQTVTAGGTATFTAAASGSPAPSVQWQVDAGAGFTDMPGQTSTTLTLSGVTAVMNGNAYRAVFTNSVGTDTSTAVTLTVNTPAAVTGDSTATGKVGDAFTYSFTVSGFPAPTVTIGGDGLPAGVTFNPTAMTIAGTPAVGTEGTYQLTVTAHNGIGDDATLSVTLTVDPDAVDNLAPTITGLAQVGQTLTAHPGPVSPSDAALAYVWKANGTPIANATSSTYKLKAAQAGKTITVTITASSPPLTPQTKTSDPTPYVRDKVDGDEIKLDQSTAARGGSLGLLGKGLVPGAVYQVAIGGTSLGSFTADVYGEINQTVTIPTTIKTGLQIVTITAPNGNVASTLALITDNTPR